MIRKIVAAPDSMKGSLTAAEMAGCCCRAAMRVLPGCETVALPLADGGEGTVDALVSAMNGKMVTVSVPDPLGRPVDASYGIVGENADTAVIEMAAASGLPLLADSERNPMLTSTRGTGALMADALSRGCRRLLIGIGGSATNDGGMGMLAALGYRILNSEGREADCTGASLGEADSIDASGRLGLLDGVEIIVACDVTNPMYGPEGSSAVFGPQKGADPAMVDLLDKGMRHWAGTMERATGVDVGQWPGAGAAGGLGGALMAVLGAKLEKGITMVLDAVGFDAAVEGADLVITGEGRLDSQTVMGKTPFGVMERCRERGIPVLAVGGAVTDYDALTRSGFMAVLPVVSRPMSLSEAMDRDVASAAVEHTVEQALRIARHFDCATSSIQW